MPSLSADRARNPCLRLRRISDGWKVRLMSHRPESSNQFPTRLTSDAAPGCDVAAPLMMPCALSRGDGGHSETGSIEKAAGTMEWWRAADAAGQPNDPAGRSPTQTARRIMASTHTSPKSVAAWKWMTCHALGLAVHDKISLVSFFKSLHRQLLACCLLVDERKVGVYRLIVLGWVDRAKSPSAFAAVSCVCSCLLIFNSIIGLSICSFDTATPFDSDLPSPAYLGRTWKRGPSCIIGWRRLEFQLLGRFLTRAAERACEGWLRALLRTRPSPPMPSRAWRPTLRAESCHWRACGRWCST